MKPMAMATSMSSARTRSGKVGPRITLATVNSMEMLRIASASVNAQSRKAVAALIETPP